MFATRETPSSQDRRNLTTGETSIDIEGCRTHSVLAADIGRRHAGLCSFSIAMICSSLNLDRFIIRLLGWSGFYLKLEKDAALRSKNA